MAKYLDYNGVKYFWQKALARFSKKGHTHTVTIPGGTATTVVTSVTDSVPPTFGTAITVKQPTKKTVVTSAAVTADVLILSTGDSVNDGTDLSVPNVTSVGSASSHTTGTVYSAASASSSATTSSDVDPS